MTASQTQDQPLPALAEDFRQLQLPPSLGQAIAELGFASATPVQRQTLPHALDGKDIIAQAQTGTGKTAAFLISIIAYELEHPPLQPRPQGTPFALIVAPTRELTLQISKDAEQLARHTPLQVLSIVGGMDYDKQRQKLGKTVDLVAATPGRLLDFARSGHIDLSQVEILVLDEADRMLSMGFIPDVKAIVRRTPHKQQRQTQLFSATLSTDIRRLAASWTLDPVLIEVAPEQVAVDTVEQKVYLVTEEEKYSVLYHLLQEEQDRVLVFVNRRDQAHRLAGLLDGHGFPAGLLAGDIPQNKRLQTLERFKRGDKRVMVATDVAGRGLHIDDIALVVNYKLPEDPEDYVHRIGRTGRAGRQGTSISLVCESDAFMLPSIEALLGDQLPCEHPPASLTLPCPPLPELPARPRAKPPRRRR